MHRNPQAHAIRLQFEAEKQQWAVQVAEACRKDQCNYRQGQGRWGSVALPGQEWGQRLPQQGGDLLQNQVLPDPQCESEFQYVLDEDLGWDSGDGTSASVGVGAMPAALVTPLKRAAKKFTVPIKQ